MGIHWNDTLPICIFYFIHNRLQKITKQGGSYGSGMNSDRELPWKPHYSMDPREVRVSFGIIKACASHHIWPNLIRIMIPSNKRFIPIALNFRLIFLNLDKQKFKCGGVVDKSKGLIHPHHFFLFIEAHLSFSRYSGHLNLLSHTLRQRLIIFLDDFYASWLRVSDMRGGRAGGEYKQEEDQENWHPWYGEKILK